jgi:hypothetical protein
MPERPLADLISELWRAELFGGRAAMAETIAQGVCAGCHQAVLWARTKETGHLMPVNPEPDPSGNIVFEDGKIVVLTKSLFEKAPDGPRYVSHFATCKDHLSYKRKKK